MNILLTILRFIHIVAAVIWVGLGGTMALFVGPAAAAAGESGLRFMKALFTKTRFAMAFPVASGLAMLAGLLLYATGDVSTFSTTGQIVLGIGALFGMAAGIHGGAIAGRTSKAFVETLAKYPDDQPIPAEGLAALRQQAMKVGSDARTSFVLMAIALIGMASARYLG